MNESLVAIIHPSWWRYRWSFTAIIVVVILDFFFLAVLRSWQQWGMVIFVCVLIGALLWTIRTVLLRHLNAMVLTSRRFIDIHQRRLFDREVAECALEKIHYVRYHKKGIIATLGNIGTVIIDAGSDRGQFALMYMMKPDDIKELIMRTQKQYIKPSETYQDDREVFNDEEEDV